MISSRDIYSDAFNTVGGQQRIVVGKKNNNPLPITFIKKPTPPAGARINTYKQVGYHDDNSTLCGASPSDGGGCNSDMVMASVVAQNYLKQTAEIDNQTLKANSGLTSPGAMSIGSSAGGGGGIDTPDQCVFQEDQKSWKDEVNKMSSLRV